jgi:hypothetical protein
LTAYACIAPARASDIQRRCAAMDFTIWSIRA